MKSVYRLFALAKRGRLQKPWVFYVRDTKKATPELLSYLSKKGVPLVHRPKAKGAMGIGMLNEWLAQL
jgi:hypothetical protein